MLTIPFPPELSSLADNTALPPVDETLKMRILSNAIRYDFYKWVALDGEYPDTPPFPGYNLSAFNFEFHHLAPKILKSRKRKLEIKNEQDSKEKLCRRSAI